MSNKWRKTGKVSGKLIKDLQAYGDFIKNYYKRLGIATLLDVDVAGNIKLKIVANTDFGPFEVHRILDIPHNPIGITTCSPLIVNHAVSIYAIYLLLNKHKYSDSITINDKITGSSVALEQEAQTQLMNLQLI